MATLSPSTASELRRRLDAARRDLVAHVRARLEATDEPAAISLFAKLGQPDDMAQASYLADNEVALLGREQGLLRDIDSAIARLDNGVANMCMVCGQSIPDERLLATPTVQTCVACQQRLEAQVHAPRAPTM